MTDHPGDTGHTDHADGLGETDDGLKGHLVDYLRQQREALRAKLDGLSEQQVRMPRTPTGTNLLGLLKHCASCELGYFGVGFDRPSTLPVPWDAPGADPDDNLDMFATESESMADVLGFIEACFAHADATIAALDLDAPGQVPWWPEGRRRVTLGQILAHVALDEARHAGHADILRELIDGQVGRRGPGDNLPEWDEAAWATYVQRLERFPATRSLVPRATPAPCGRGGIGGQLAEGVPLAGRRRRTGIEPACDGCRRTSVLKTVEPTRCPRASPRRLESTLGAHVESRHDGRTEQ